MFDFEEKWVMTSMNRPSVWFRYVDDTFALFDDRKSASQFYRISTSEGRKAIGGLSCDFTVLHKIQCKFTTPHSPHQGGHYESLIKQTKWSLCVAIGNQVLSWNKMSTVYAEVDPQPLMPNHLLLGRASPCVPQGQFEESANRRKRFSFVQNLAQQVWRRLIRDYVSTLTRRSKWQTSTHSGRCCASSWFHVLTGKMVTRPGQGSLVRMVLSKTSWWRLRMAKTNELCKNAASEWK